jgi:hypothetical protein
LCGWWTGSISIWGSRKSFAANEGIAKIAMNAKIAMIAKLNSLLAIASDSREFVLIRG